MYEVREVLRLWLRGEGLRPVAVLAGVDRKTVRRYVDAAVAAGVVRDGGEGQLSDGLIGSVVEAVRPHRCDGRGDGWRLLAANHDLINGWLTGDGLTVVKVHDLLTRRGVAVAERTLHRYALEVCDVGRGRRGVTVRVNDGEPGDELQVDFGKMGLIADPVSGRRRVCQALVFTPVVSRYSFVWLTLTQTTVDVIAGFEAAWQFYGGIFATVIPDNMKTIVDQANRLEPRLNQCFVEYAQSRGFVVDPARVRSPQDKGCVSYCSSRVVCDVGFVRRPVLGRSAGLFVGRHGRHPVVVGAFVVEGFSVESAFVVPAFDGLGADAEPVGGLFEVEETAGGEAFGSGWEVMLDAYVVDDAGVEGLSGAGDDPGLVEFVGDTAFGVTVEQPIDVGDDVVRGAPGLGGRERDGDVEAGGGAAFETYVHGDVVAAGQGDVLDEQADHPFAFAVRGARI